MKLLHGLYMDAGIFNGALYLDETTHDFTINMPTALGTNEFWLSFRYDQSATAAALIQRKRGGRTQGVRPPPHSIYEVIFMAWLIVLYMLYR